MRQYYNQFNILLSNKTALTWQNKDLLLDAEQTFKLANRLPDGESWSCQSCILRTLFIKTHKQTATQCVQTPQNVTLTVLSIFSLLNNQQLSQPSLCVCVCVSTLSVWFLTSCHNFQHKGECQNKSHFDIGSLGYFWHFWTDVHHNETLKERSITKWTLEDSRFDLSLNVILIGKY